MVRAAKHPTCDIIGSEVDAAMACLGTGCVDILVPDDRPRDIRPSRLEPGIDFNAYATGMRE